MTTKVTVEVLQESNSEHQELERQYAAFDAILGGEVVRAPVLRRRLSELAVILKCHFAHEEEGGFFKEIIDMAPRLSRRADELESEHDALLAELSSGRLHAVLDVTEPEPLPAESPFLSLPNVYLTPHVAGSLGSELHRLADNVLDEIERFLSTGSLNHEVTKANWDRIA